jgi:hypothetical protein
MPAKPTNIAASVSDRLRNVAKQKGRDFQLTLTSYVLERLLYRLSKSRYRKEFVLKGALLQSVWLEDVPRATRDLDLHSGVEQDAGRILQSFRSILKIRVADDGVVFNVKGLEAVPIRENASYGGVRVTTVATLGRAEIPVRIDIGFGDAITPKPKLVEYPSLLGLPKARLLVYPRETAVAEKFEAMVSLGLSNSRMKDFFDVALFANSFEFSGQILSDAIAATFKRRGTLLPIRPPPAFTDAFTKRRETIELWNAFVRRESIPADYASLDTTIGLLASFLMPPTLAAVKTARFSSHWPANGPWSEGARRLS